MAKWQTNTESGILRKNIVKDTHEELLVFGYACKLFRDDEKALYIDKGKHLIPWMGNEDLKIDRYDGRGALPELSQFEASREGYDAMRWLDLSDSERHIEQLCDEERYYALNVNEDEEVLYKEEEIKRQQRKNNEYQFNYDVQPEPKTEEVHTVELEDEPFIPPPDLDVPSDIAVPSTVRENTRIEKTALFVSKQGLQMEILIKTKQADNPQFSFLNQNHPLYKYYKHLLMIIKSGRYKIQSKENYTEQSKEETHENESIEEHYLHPSLLATTVLPANPPTSSPTVVPYKPSANCKYLQLVNRIQGNQQLQQQVPVASVPQQEPPAVPVPPQQPIYDQQQYYQQYYYAMQYYEYYKQMAMQYNEGGKVDPKVVQYFQNLSQLSHFLQGAQNVVETQVPDNPYAQIVSNLVKNKEQVAVVPVTTSEVASQPQVAANIAKAPIMYNQEGAVSSHITPKESTPVGSPQVEEKSPERVGSSETKAKNVPKHPLLHFAQYNSDSDENSESENDEDNNKSEVLPSKEVQLVIEKMASYVSKNGTEFEEIVRAKGDPRFEFLNKNHQFHNFYKQKLQQFTQLKSVQEPEQVKEKELPKIETTSPDNKPKEKKIIAPVSFSIKKAKEETPKEIKSALPIEESDEEEDQNGSSCTSTSVPQVQEVSGNAQDCSPSRTPPLKDLTQFSQTENDNESDQKATETVGDLMDAEDPILEMIDLTDDVEERRENKRAEDRKKDKIAAAARERIALQLERKRKAAAFLKLMSSDSAKTIKKDVTPTSDVEIVSAVKTSSEKSIRNKSEYQSTSKNDLVKNNSKDKERNNSSDTEMSEIKSHKSSKKKKSHKRKKSKDKHSSKHHKKNKKRRRSKSIESYTSNGS